MRVNPQQLLDDGFIILRQVIPPDQLRDLRASFETLVDRQRQIWTQEADPDNPTGGIWETGAQPRLVDYQSLIDPQTAAAVEIWLHNHTLGVSRQLMCRPEETAVAGMMLMCSPQNDHGPAKWHRDIHPVDMAPLDNLQRDFLENGPKYVQWNIPLYDDDVFWVVPGSHIRLNDAEENRELSANPQLPITGGTPVKLKAGDGVVYSNFLLHWGSNYSTRMRRTIHGGHTIFPFYHDLEFTMHLQPDAQETFQAWNRASATKQDLTEVALRAAMAGDVARYSQAVDALQPGAGPAGKLLQTIYLSKAAYHIRLLHSPDLTAEPVDARSRATKPHSITLNWGPNFASRFGRDEAEVLWIRFQALDAALQADEDHFVPGFQAHPMRYYFDRIPQDLSFDSVVADWNSG